MDHFTLAAYQLEQRRRADLVRDTEMLRMRAEREPAAAVTDAPAPHSGVVAAAWHRLLETAHLGHPVAH